MDLTQVHLLLVEARSAAQELYDIQRPIVVSPGTLHSLAQSLIDLTTACEGLHSWGLVWMLQAAARREPPRDVV
jgi:hypothetical protein